MSEHANNGIQNVTLSAKEIKLKIEDALAYDHDKYPNTEILFKNSSAYSKLPFTGFKISISEELSGQNQLMEDIKKHMQEKVVLLEEVCEEDEMYAEAPSYKEDEEDINIVEEIYEFDEIEDEDVDEDEEDDELAMSPYGPRAKKPKGYTIKIVDVDKVVRKIKDEALVKNEGKQVMGRRQINKLLKPYMLKKYTNIDIEGIDDPSLTSIDIYLNAVDKIANTNNEFVNKNLNDTLELNIKSILKDLDDKNK